MVPAALSQSSSPLLYSLAFPSPRNSSYSYALAISGIQMDYI
jgi:hypothetical protein